MKSFALHLNLMCALYMCGVIWLIQLIHYPSFLMISTESFQRFHTQHTTVMGLLVGPVMILELLVALWLFQNETHFLNLANLILVISLWLLTFLVSVPLHNKLAMSQDLTAMQNLIQTNWPRTILWTSRAILASYLTFTNFKL